LKLLFERVAVPVAGLGTKGAWLVSRRLVAIDGVHLDVADTPDNLDAFGRFANGPKSAAFPQLGLDGAVEAPGNPSWRWTSPTIPSGN
jgi:hypothetical protein